MVITYSCELENFSSQVFEHGCDIDGSLGTYAHLVLGVLLQETLDTSARELSGEMLVGRYIQNILLSCSDDKVALLLLLLFVE